MMQFRKRFTSSESERSAYKYENSSKPNSFRLNSPSYQYKKSDPATIFNDSSVKEYYEQRVNQAKSGSPARPQQFYCQEPGCFKSFSSEYNLKVHIKTAHLKIREFV
mmetsp:Transcript_25165/g.24931  ORF Transcript_25165/g.24931 Transcript_25165/m.24931 type:complete len:107 (+) Transcript_25165:619-939(+)